MTNAKKLDRDKESIALLSALINRYRSEGLKGVLPDCNSFGNPELNTLYVEVYKASQNNTPLLTLAGAGMFIEQFVKEMWVSSKLHQEQVKANFHEWDEVMAKLEALYVEVDTRQVMYTADFRPILSVEMETIDLEALELLWDFIRNNVIHTSRTRLLGKLSDNGVIDKQIPVGKMTFTKSGLVVHDTVKMSVTHPMILKEGFKTIAQQLAPALVIFTFDLFKKYHAKLAPLKDEKLGFVGHSCEYD